MDDIYKIFIVKVQMSTCDAGDGSSYRILTDINIEHFLNTATRDLLHSMDWSPGLNLNNPKWNVISNGKSSCIIFKCVMYAATCHNFVSSPEYTGRSKVKMCVSTISETTPWPVFVYLPLSDQWLHNNWGNATLVL